MINAEEIIKRKKRCTIRDPERSPLFLIRKKYETILTPIEKEEDQKEL